MTVAQSQQQTILDIDFPDWFEPFWEPARYKIAFGGRGSGKSTTFARALICRAAERPQRVLCARELQNSIQDSVHQLIADQIAILGLSGLFTVKEKGIYSHCGSEFLFKGLRGTRGDASQLKSLEGVDICWIEEGQTVSKASMETLVPTIRKPGSEIWITFNPDQESDPVYQLAMNPPDSSIVRQVNWNQNPWFPPELELERQWMQRTDPDAYAHCWIHGGRLYIEHEAWQVGCEIDQTPALFDTVPGSREHLIRADSARPETISYMRRQGFRIIGVKKGKGSVEDGVAHLRGYEQIIIHPRCAHTAEEARLWSFKVDKLSGDVLPKLEDKNNHCIAEGQMVVTGRGEVPVEDVIAGDLVLTRRGFRQVVEAWMASPSRETIVVETGDARVECTPDHKIYTLNRGFVEARTLTQEDCLLVYEETLCQKLQASKLSFTKGSDIGDIQMPGINHPGGTFSGGNPEFLHRRVFEDNYGPIPEGFHVHHIDGDPSNNDPSNLVAVSRKDHSRLHWNDERAMRLRQHLDTIRPLSKAWHSSPEGREVHRRIGALAYKNFIPATKQCAYCGKDFKTRMLGHQDKFCSNACRSAHRRASGADDEQRICVICGQYFTTNKYRKTQTCSFSCRGHLIHKNKKESLRSGSC